MPSQQILLVEDDAIIAFDLQLRLESLGYQVMATVSSGEEAISLVNQSLPGLILMDVHLAGVMDGITAALRILEQHRVPLIFVTAYSDAGTLQRIAQIPGSLYVSKPFAIEDLTAMIDVALHPLNPINSSETPPEPSNCSSEIVEEVWADRAIYYVRAGTCMTPEDLDGHYTRLAVGLPEAKRLGIRAIIYDFRALDGHLPIGALFSAAQQARKKLDLSLLRNMVRVFVVNSDQKASILQIWMRLTGRTTEMRICFTMEEAMDEVQRWHGKLS